jgi:hypothetical protein
MQLAGDVALLDRGSLPIDGGVEVDGEREEVAAAIVHRIRVAARIGRDAGASLEPGALRGAARGLADASLAAGIDTLHGLTDDGWDAILGEPIGGADRPRLGADAVIERNEPFSRFVLERPPGSAAL